MLRTAPQPTDEIDADDMPEVTPPRSTRSGAGGPPSLSAHELALSPVEKRLAALPYRCLPPSKWTVEHVVDWAETSFDWALPTRVRKTPAARLFLVRVRVLVLLQKPLAGKSSHIDTRCNDVDRCLAVVLSPQVGEAVRAARLDGLALISCSGADLGRYGVGPRGAGGEYRREQMLAVLHDPWTWGFE